MHSTIHTSHKLKEGICSIYTDKTIIFLYIKIYKELFTGFNKHLKEEAQIVDQTYEKMHNSVNNKRTIS